MTNPSRGEVWLVNLDPTLGQEIQKTRPVVVINSNLFAPIPLRIIIPITTWQEKFHSRPFMVKLSATETNGLVRKSAANVLQVRSLSIQRFTRHLGQLEPDIMTEILAGLIVCVDYEGN